MCYRRYYRYKCCALEKDVDWVACEDNPPGLNCPKAQEHNWQGPYAEYQGDITGPCWNCLWASFNDGGKAKREFIENAGKPKPGDEPWESDEERKDQRMAGEDWYWIMRRRQKKRRERERRRMEAETAKASESVAQCSEGIEGTGRSSGSSTPGTSGSRPASRPTSRLTTIPSLPASSPVSRHETTQPRAQSAFSIRPARAYPN